MPYIFTASREQVLQDRKPATCGELNFLITTLCIEYATRGGALNYARINDTIGALESAKLEFYRRLVAPYEDTKIAENGDVYP